MGGNKVHIQAMHNKETIFFVRKDPKSTDHYVEMFDGIKFYAYSTYILTRGGLEWEPCLTKGKQQ